MISLACRRKNLIPVKWTFDTSSATLSGRSVESTPATQNGDATPEPKPRAPKDDERPPMCPSCKKQLSNNTLMHRACPLSLFLSPQAYERDL